MLFPHAPADDQVEHRDRLRHQVGDRCGDALQERYGGGYKHQVVDRYEDYRRDAVAKYEAEARVVAGWRCL